ncbi:hypothetical protein N7488_008981 [Penicillium malachiteum]|nr:hypothetical protein N7488_008981 [Penicillium malachiteum]
MSKAIWYMGFHTAIEIANIFDHSSNASAEISAISIEPIDVFFPKYYFKILIMAGMYLIIVLAIDKEISAEDKILARNHIKTVYETLESTFDLAIASPGQDIPADLEWTKPPSPKPANLDPRLVRLIQRATGDFGIKLICPAQPSLKKARADIQEATEQLGNMAPASAETLEESLTVETNVLGHPLTSVSNSDDFNKPMFDLSGEDTKSAADDAKFPDKDTAESAVKDEFRTRLLQVKVFDQARPSCPIS